MRNQIASIGINQSEETYLLAPKSLYKGEPLYKCQTIIYQKPSHVYVFRHLSNLTKLYLALSINGFIVPK